MKLTIDMESRSTCDLKKHGAHVYSEDPSTEILCISYKQPNAPAEIWRRGEDPSKILQAISSADTIEAHNLSNFEYPMWRNICEKRLGWPALAENKLRCSMAKASMHALPRGLGEVCGVLGLRQQKDMTGYRVMMKLCRPRKPRKGEEEGIYWNEDPADFETLFSYCKMDICAEEELSLSLSDLPPKELELWELDRKINQRGIQVDLDSAKVMIKMISEHETKLLSRLKILTHGSVKTAKQVENMRGFLRGLGLDLPDLTAGTVKAALLREDLTPEVREILEIRRSLGRSSSAKYQAFIDRASRDGRIRGTTLYHGASTGRFASTGVNIQNLASRISITDPPEAMLEVIRMGGLELHNALYDDDPMSTAGALTRSILTAAEGKELMVGDLSAIEGRFLAWLADEDTELEIYRSGRDPYIATAASILHKKYEDVTKKERQVLGKTAVLACGYSGSVGAVRKFGGEGMTDDEIKEQIVYPWREAHPRTVAFWYDLESAARAAVENPGKIYTAGKIRYRVKGKFLQCRLPSGRILYYYDPDIRVVKKLIYSRDPVTKEILDIQEIVKEAITFMTVDAMTKKWIRGDTYSGRLAENVTQAGARDILVEGMFAVEKAGYPIVMTVHDEIVSEIPEGYGSEKEFEELMSRVPAWAEGLPLGANVFRTKRYKK